MIRRLFVPVRIVPALVLLPLAALSGFAPGEARADAPAPSATPVSQSELSALLVKLAEHAARFEQMKKRGSYTLTGKMEKLDGDAHVDETKEMIMRVVTSAHDRRVEVVRYTEDGVDKTGEAQKKADDRRAERQTGKKDDAKDLKLPFLRSEWQRYTFAIVERAAGQVRIAFTPFVAEEDALKGSAWVDPVAGEVTSLGFSLSKNPTFVDHVEVKVRFDQHTSLGLAPSAVSFDFRGGFLFVHKHYRGSATITDQKLGF